MDGSVQHEVLHQQQMDVPHQPALTDSVTRDSNMEQQQQLADPIQQHMDGSVQHEIPHQPHIHDEHQQTQSDSNHQPEDTEHIAAQPVGNELTPGLPPSTTSNLSTFPDISEFLFVNLPFDSCAGSNESTSTSVHPMVTRLQARQKMTNKQPTHQSHIVTQQHTTTLCTEPRNHKQALKDLTWTKAMKEELNALQENQTWQLVPPPRDTNIVGSKWIFKIKYKEDGTTERHKARLVAQ